MIRRYRWKGNFTPTQLDGQVPPGVAVTIKGTNNVETDLELLPNPISAAAAEDLDFYLSTLGWAFLEADPTTPMAPIEVRFPPEYNNNKGDYLVHYIAAGGSSNFAFAIPSDFKTLTKICMVAIPNNTSAGGDMDLSSDYGKVGEQYNAHSESNAGVPFSGTAGELIEVDLSSVFSSLEAGDSCGLFLNQNGITGGMNYLYVLLQYTNN